MNYFYMNTLPIARARDGCLDEYYAPIVSRAARLICTEEEFEDLWERVFSPEWTKPEFRYPDAISNVYGPIQEQNVRRNIAESSANLTSEWSPKNGIHDRLPDRRDTGDRAQLRTEIDAYVAHLYGINRDDFTYILDTFPVLKKKEQNAFGEFMSKRKCLEEYDRIKQIMNAEGA